MRGREYAARAVGGLCVRPPESLHALATVLDSRFICENPDCEAFGDEVESRF